MNTLFPLETFLPEGFKYYEDFLTVEEEKLLCRIISTLELKPLIFQGFEAKRKIAGFGVEYHFNSRSISAGNQIPEKFDFLLNKVSKISGISSADLAKMLITEYPPGSVINWHRDGPPFETIIGISLLSDCIFKMRPYDKKNQSRSSIINVSVKKRSLYILKNDSREKWEHSIAPVKEMRYSITLRTLRNSFPSK